MQGEIRALPYPLDPLTLATVMPQNDNTPNPSNQPEGAARTRIEFRCTPAEKQQIVSNAANVGAEVSEYCRAKALNQKPQSNTRATGERKLLIESLGQLGKIGSNVNQLARAFNQGKAVEAAALVKALQEVEQCGAAIRAELTKGKP